MGLDLVQGKKVTAILTLSIVATIFLSGCIGETTTQSETTTTTAIPTTTTTIKTSEISGLASIGRPQVLWENWDADPEGDGLKVGFSFKDAEGNYVYFDNIPVDVTIRLYTEKLDQTTFKYYKDRLVYERTFTITSDKDVNWMMGKGIKISKEHILVNPATDREWGILEVVVHTQTQGDFSGSNDVAIRLYEK